MRAKALYLAAALSLLVDQATKIGVVFGLDLVTRLRLDVLPPLLRFRYGENRGINFGLFDGDGGASRWILIVVSLLICAAVYLWVRRSHADRTVMQVAAGLVIGGALGNVVDRIAYGYVLDFLNMSCCGIQNPFVFNVADIFIFAGAAGLILYEGRGKNPA
ncbi:signal peptidase II [Tritonibacter horizontis]|uniref:Lipoprotein signal peptidase n=1 Tax=Tritonibacter horizontis TaxID=1768241 RepID=A0A132BWZ7_9RHOB|nr:signal peptidase II [Tritonibacter horizontis]KUP92824.1 lipoprotein signal peptidase [Tritonibacter horizontis]